MPRDGSGNYTYPPGTPGIPDTTIESAKYNGYIADVQQDLNLPRPIVAGGTGANNATQARDNLDAEVASKQVTNYDSHVWEAGSFWSAVGATGAPTADHIYGGTAIIPNNDPNVVILEATDTVSGTRYTRLKYTTWGAWSSMTTISAEAPSLVLNRLDDQAAYIAGQKNGVNRWLIQVGDASTETGTANAGSDFSISRFSDAGAFIDVPLHLSRGNAAAAFVGSVTSSSGFFSLQNYVATSPNVVLAATGSGNIFLRPNGDSNAVGQTSIATSGNMTVAGSIATSGNMTVAGSVDAVAAFSVNALAGNNANVLLNDETGANKGNLFWSRSTNEIIMANAGSLFAVALAPTGQVIVGSGLRCRPGLGGTLGGNAYNFNWTGTVFQAWIDSVNLGTVSFTSDYRIKKDVTDLAPMWDTVKALRPIRYTQAQYTPQSEIERRIGEAAGKETLQPMFVADDIERWGFIAHELQETLVPSAASGVKDAPDTIQSPNPFTLIAALTKALQEAMARIEALEGAQATP